MVWLLLGLCAGLNFDEVNTSPRAYLVEFYSGMCGYCKEFEPTWQQLTSKATRLESWRVNIDEEAGSQLATRLGILDLGIPAVVLFDSSDDYQPLMAAELFPLSRILKRVYHATRGQNLALDSDGFFLKKPS